jgi:uncharacterized protein (DUF2345 family)
MSRQEHQRPVNSALPSGDSGPYLARVLSHLDNKFMGSLKVQLLRVSDSGTHDLTDRTMTAYYASPFYGSTSHRSLGNTDDYRNSQQSYGMWFVPPDPDTTVLVTMVEGRADICFWFACVQDDYMNFMIPDGRASTVLTSEGSGGQSGRRLPVGEYNKRIVNPQGNNQPTSYPKPVNQDFVDKLTEAGLLEDDHRGLTSSSARRELPSAVFGVNTPGPLDKRPGAPSAPRGPSDDAAIVPRSRLGGHSLVMDDGDDKLLRRTAAGDGPPEYVSVETDGGALPEGAETRPANELFRIRTRTGHQILLHNTEDLIYISNSRGTAWIELTSNGKIDIYAQDSISMHTERDFNVTADGNMNLTAGKSINLNATDSIRQTAGANIDVTSIGYTSVNAADSLSLQSGQFTSINAGTNLNLASAGGDTVVFASGSFSSESGSSTTFNANNFQVGTNTNINLYAGAAFNIQATGSDYLVNGVIRITGDDGLNLLSTNDTRISGDNVEIKAVGALRRQAGNSEEFVSGAINRTGATIDDKSDVHNLGPIVSIFGTLDTKGAITTDGSIASKGGISTASTINAVGNIRSPNIAESSVSVSVTASTTTPATALPSVTAFSAQNSAPPEPKQYTGAIPPTPAKIADRVPEHEPWFQHENFNPQLYSAGGQGDTFVSALPDTFLNIGRNRPNTSGTATQLKMGSRSYGGSTDEDVGEETFNAKYENGEQIPNEPYTEAAIEVIEFFRSKGLTDAQACGIAGAIQVESGLNIEPGAYLGPQFQDSNGKVVGAGGVGARGIVQWRGARDRLYGVEQFLGKPILVQTLTDVNAVPYREAVNDRLPTTYEWLGGFARAEANASRAEQLAAVWWELAEGGDGIATTNFDRIRDVDTGNGISDARLVAFVFDDIFLRSGGQKLSTRQDFGEVLFRHYVGEEAVAQIFADINASRPDIPVDTLASPFYTSTGGVQNVVTNAYSAKTRSDNVDIRLIDCINRAANASGITEVRIQSAAQLPLRTVPKGYNQYDRWFTFPVRNDIQVSGGNAYKIVNGQRTRRSNGNFWRTGSERHDTGLAADIDLYINGSIVNSATQAGKTNLIRFLRAAVNYGMRGFGHADGYMGTTRTHIDLLGQLTSNGWDNSRIASWGGTSLTLINPCVEELAIARSRTS